MEIVCATDNNFVQHCVVMLVSVLVNNKSVSIHVLTEGLTIENEKLICDEVFEKGGKVYFYTIDNDILKKFPMPSNRFLNHISIATYYRLLVSDVLPNTLNKIIYLDCDIIVRKSLDELWKTDIVDYAIAGVKQIGHSNQCRRLMYPEDFGYFNAGVLLINLDYWRDNSVSKTLIEYLVNNFDSIVYHDQDALNFVLHEKFLLLPCKWNMIALIPGKRIFGMADRDIQGHIINNYDDYKKELTFELRDPTVIHYVSKPKPWQRHCFHRWQKSYFEYCQLTLNYAGLKYDLLDNLISILFHEIKMIFYSIYKKFII